MRDRKRLSLWAVGVWSLSSCAPREPPRTVSPEHGALTPQSRAVAALEGRAVYSRGAPGQGALVACEGGRADVCNDLGYFYESTGPSPVDHVKVASLYDDACRLGAQAGCNNLALLLRSPAHGTDNAALSEQLLRRACDAGEPMACRNLACSF